MFRSVINGIVKLLNNTSEDQVAADAGISGPVKILLPTRGGDGTLIQNAFFKAIPWFGKEHDKA